MADFDRESPDGVERQHSLFVIMPVHGRIHLTEECLQSLWAQSDQDFHTVVVDDGSPDNTRQVLKQKYLDVTVLEGDGSLWWSGAVNKGIEYALEQGADYVLLLNNDTRVEPDFVEQMRGWAARKPEAIMCAAMRDLATGEFVFGGEHMRWLTAGTESLLDVLPPEERHGIHPVTHCPGRGLWIPVGVFDEVGLFDADNFPQTAADYDLTIRAHRAGRELYCNYDASLISLSDTFVNRRKRNVDATYSLKGYIFHLTDIRSPNNLAGNWRFAIKNAPRWALLPHLLITTLGSVGSYPVRWLRAGWRKRIN